MEKCPIEIVQEILSALVDFECLESMILTCRDIWAAFGSRKAPILQEGLANTIPRALWFEAEMAQLAANITDDDDWDRRTLVMQQYLSRNVQLFNSTFRLNLRHCKALAAFYRMVDAWTDDSVDRTLGSFTIHGYPRSPPLDAVTITHAERVRIQRCFYRFNIFCGIFCTAHPTTERQGEELLRQYLTHFTPWEHEHFACVRDYLRSVLRSGTYNFNHFTKPCQHKVDQHAYNSTQMQPVHIDYHLSRGLAHILAVLDGEIVTTSDATNIIISSLPPRVLAEHLRWAAPDNTTLGWAPDGDPGAAAIWRRAYHMEEVRNYVDCPRQEALRAWGYVFWDHSRLKGLGVFSLQWDTMVQLWV